MVLFVLIGILQEGEPITHPSGGAGQIKDEAAGTAAAEKGAQELPPRQGKLGEGCSLAERAEEFLVSLLALPLPCCVT